MILLTETKLSTNPITNDERIEYILSDRWIGYPRAKAILQTMEELMHHPRTYRMPNMLLVAPTNNGKTILLQKFFDAYKPVITPETQQTVIHVLYVQAPPIPNEKAFYCNILSALNAPYTPNTTGAMLQYQVIRILRKVQTKVLIIDEIHHILAGSYLSQRAFLNLIKYLSNELQIVIIGSGIRDAFSAINTDKQLANRFEPAVLPTWKPDGEYFRLLSSFEAMFPLHQKSNLTKEEIAIKILSMSGGTIGEISMILKKAAVLAIKTGKEMIDLSLLTKINYIGPAHRQRQYESMLL
jgi:type II secretory pathway predicted ATPase ExeA